MLVLKINPHSDFIFLKTANRFKLKFQKTNLPLARF
jgi:hypothetical protein